MEIIRKGFLTIEDHGVLASQGPILSRNGPDLWVSEKSSQSVFSPRLGYGAMRRNIPVLSSLRALLHQNIGDNDSEGEVPPREFLSNWS